MQIRRRHFNPSVWVFFRMSLVLLFFMLFIQPIAAQEFDGSYQGKMTIPPNPKPNPNQKITFSPFAISFTVTGSSMRGTLKRTQEYIVKRDNYTNIEHTNGEIRGTVNKSGTINATLRGTIAGEMNINNKLTRTKSTFTGTLTGRIQGSKAYGSWTTKDTEDSEESSNGSWQANTQASQE
jgi:hypothetical protein